MPFTFQEGCIKDLFVTEVELIDRFTGQELWLWGNGGNGRLGDNTTATKSSPVQTIASGNDWKQVSLGVTHSAAIKTDGTLWVWGDAAFGILGINSTLDKSSPVQTIAGGNNWKQVSLGGNHSAAIKTDGTLWIWGYGGGGRLGTNATASRSSPVQTISGGTDWKQVSLGCCHSAGIKTDGTLWLWGYAGSGRLGDNTVINKSSPVQTVSGGTNWKQVNLGGDHSAAIKTDGTLWLWGRGTAGQLGSAGGSRSSPIQTISGGNDWKDVSAGRYHTSAIKTDGTLWSWGCNDGALGDNAITNKSSPVQTIAGGNNWKQVSAGNVHTAAIKTDGTLWVWGQGGFGRLGDNTISPKSSPVQTVSGGTSWRQVSLGLYHSSATRITEY